MNNAELSTMNAMEFNAFREQLRDVVILGWCANSNREGISANPSEELLDEQNATHLHIAGVEEIISRTNLTAGLFAANVVSRGISSVIKDILTRRQGSYINKVPLPKEFYGKPFMKVFDYFKQEYDATIIAIDKKDERGVLDQQINPPYDQVLESGDQLVMLVQRDSAMCDLE